MRLTSSHDYPVPPDRVAALFADARFSTEVARAAGALEPRVDVARDPSGEFTLTARTVNPSVQLPAQIRPLAPRGLEIRQAQVWEAPGPDGGRRATLAGEIVGASVRITGTVTLAVAPGGCRLTFAGEIKALIPLLGATVENAAAPAVEAYLEAQDRVAREWLARGA
ncbi:MAG: DUF2505 domain-containing protein [Bifidobacteriaceae bacterium]|jgi:hypothetical protein|nr:DUF2505 domain-containing protein [Bifidobacteriaceae bacterium]